MPGIIIGCAVGGLYAELQAWVLGGSIAESYAIPSDGSAPRMTAVTFVLTGAGAMLSSYTRLTFSLLVIMLETTSSINIFLPMTFAIFTARVVGNMFTNSLYDRAIRGKNMPFLRSEAPSTTRNLPAYIVMSKELVTLPTIANMDACKKALQTSHNAFPVLNTAGKLVGLIPKSMVVKVIEMKSFYDKESTDRSNLVSTEDKKLNNSDELMPSSHGDGSLLLTNHHEAPQGDSQMHGLDYDENNGFPRTPHEQVIDWRNFMTDVYSNEADAEHCLDVIEENFEEWIDLRPYMIEHPPTVTVHDCF